MNKHIHSETDIPTAEQNLADADTYGEDFVPAPDIVENPVHEPAGPGSLPEVDTHVQESDIDFVPDQATAPTTFGPDGETTSTEVAGQVQTVESVAEPAVSEDGLLGDAGEEITDTATPEANVYDFDSSDIVAIEVPVREADDSEILEMIEVQPGVFALKSAYLRKNSRVRSSAFFRGETARKFIASSKAVKHPLISNLQNRVIALKSSGKGVIFQHSNILGLVAVEAPLVKGIINSKYSLFTTSKGHLVNQNAQELTSSTHQRVIASVTSNRGVKNSAISRNLFSEVERGYISYLMSRYNNLKTKANAALIKSNAENKALRRELARIKSQHEIENKNLRTQLEQSATSLVSLRQSVLAARNPVQSEADRQAAEKQRIQSQAQIDRLSRMML